MQKLTLGIAVLATLVAGARAGAADMPLKAAAPVVASYDWSGFYGGGSIGGVWAQTHRFYPQAVGGPLNSDIDIDEAIIGLHGGGQVQWGRIVLGAEAGWNKGFDGLRNSTPLPTPPFAADTSAVSLIDNLFTVGGRLGFAWDRILLYGTGGYARADVIGQYAFTSTGLERFTAFSGRARHEGWYAGAGVEYVLNSARLADVIVGVEWQHFDLGRENTFCFNAGCSPVNAEDYSINARGDIVRARLTVKVNPWRS